jgi:hypothetical protein
VDLSEAIEVSNIRHKPNGEHGMIKKPHPGLVRTVEALGWQISRCDVVHRAGHQACRAGWHAVVR